MRIVAEFGFMENLYRGDPARRGEFGVNSSRSAPRIPEPRELLPGQRSDLAPLRRRAFMQMARSVQVIADYYGLPSGRVIEIGTRLEI